MRACEPTEHAKAVKYFVGTASYAHSIVRTDLGQRRLHGLGQIKVMLQRRQRILGKGLHVDNIGFRSGPPK